MKFFDPSFNIEYSLLSVACGLGILVHKIVGKVLYTFDSLFKKANKLEQDLLNHLSECRIAYNPKLLEVLVRCLVRILRDKH